MRLRNTRKWADYWTARKGMVEGYASRAAVMHPHRDLVCDAFSEMGRPRSVLELGCATGPNLVRLKAMWPDLEVGGIDVNEEAIGAAVRAVPGGKFQRGDIRELYFTSNCTDAVLTDAALIYVEPKLIREVLSEIRRITSYYVVFCEFHHTSWVARTALRLGAAYYSYDWVRLLEGLDFYDVSVRKIPKNAWPGEPWESYGHIITARAPRV